VSVCGVCGCGCWCVCVGAVAPHDRMLTHDRVLTQDKLTLDTKAEVLIWAPRTSLTAALETVALAHSSSLLLSPVLNRQRMETRPRNASGRQHSGSSRGPRVCRYSRACD
jgi:hypothetical protein